LSALLVHPNVLPVVQQVGAECYNFFSRFETRVEVRIFFSDA
jgi:hypothetical protein